MKKYYIAPDIDCIDMEPLQVIAASVTDTTPGTEPEYEGQIGSGSGTVGGENSPEADSKQHSGGIWEF